MTKKLLFSLMASMLVVTVFGQEQIQEDHPKDLFPSAKVMSNARSSGVFNYIEVLKKRPSSSLSHFYYYLFPDSTVISNVSNDGRPWNHSTGQILDPTADVFDLFAENGAMPENAEYTLDSINFYYRYYRPQTDAPDTLLFQFYVASPAVPTGGPMEFVENGFTNQIPYSRVFYDYIKSEGKNSIKTVTVLLDDSHKSETQNNINIPVDLVIPAGHKVAYTVSYKPGNAYNEGDTIQFDAQPTNKINTFLAYVTIDNDKYIEAKKYNHGLIITSAVSHNYSTGWNGRFIPGVAYNAGYRHYYVDFLISSSVGIKNKTASSDMKLAPNPVSVGNNAKVLVDLPVSAEFQLKVTDISGKQVSALNRNLNAGKQQVEIATSHLSPGLYFVSAENGNKSLKTIKLVVTQ